MRTKKIFGNEFALQTFHTFAQMRKKPTKIASALQEKK